MLAGWSKLKKILISSKAFTIFAILVYASFTVIYMGPSIWDCNDTLSGIGDNTGGPIWRMGLEPNQPLLGGTQKQTNYPAGENLYSPVGYAALAQSVIMRGATELVGPVCAYNVFNMAGFLTTAIVMFAFIRYLVKSRWIALLSGYAVAFTPYVQSKIGGHPSYGFASMIIVLVWLTLHIIKNRKYVHGAMLGSCLALCAYFDPYFILFAITVIPPMIIVWLSGIVVKNWGQLRRGFGEAIPTFRVFAFALATFIILVSPLVFVRIKNSAVINSTTGAIRGNIEASAMMCSNLPQDYILPDPWNVHLVKLFGNKYTQNNISIRHWCGPGESRVGISLTILIIVLTGIIIFIWERLNGRKLNMGSKLAYSTGILICSVSLIALTAFLMGLPPKINGLLMPSGILIRITEMWRIYAREYLVLNLSIVILFSIVLAYFKQVIYKKSKVATIILYILLSLFIIGEYQIRPFLTPFTFSYKRDTPKIYLQIRDDPNINAIAEYPLDRTGIESDVVVYYTTMQFIHKKPILNSAAMSNINEDLHIAIKDLSDPQTIPILRKLGIEYITIHGLNTNEVLAKSDQLEIVKEETPPVYGLKILRDAPKNTFVLARIKDGPVVDYAVTLKKGFVVNMNIMKDPLTVEYETINNTILSPIPVGSTERVGGLMRVCFDAKMALPTDMSELNILVESKPVRSYQIGGQWTRVVLDVTAGDSITLNNSKGYNVRLNNLGCRKDEL